MDFHGGMVKFKLITALTLIILVLIVIFQNTQPVETRVLFVAITMPRAALLGITLLVGMAIGMLLALGLAKKLPGKS